MEINNKNIILIDSLQNRQTEKNKHSEQSKKYKTTLKTNSGVNTIIQLSDYLHVKAKTVKQFKNNITPINDYDLAKQTFDITKSQVAQDPKQLFTAQANSQPIIIFKLLS